jgi:phosphoglycerate dehydrogenase-like enzyme
VEVWLPDNPARARLGKLPEAVEINLIPREGALPQEIETVEFLVSPYGSRSVIEVLPRFTALRVVQVNSAGVDWVAPSIPEGVTLCSARGTRDAAVAEWVVGTILDSYKGLARFRRQQELAQWRPWMPRELAGSKVLIVGHGSIGRAVEDRLRPFGVEATGVATRQRGNTPRPLHDSLGDARGRRERQPGELGRARVRSGVSRGPGLVKMRTNVERNSSLTRR